MILPFITDNLLKMTVKKLIQGTECSSQVWFKISSFNLFDSGVGIWWGAG